MALRDQLHESARQDPAHPSTLERVCTALIDRDEALRHSRADLEKTRTLAANWEAEVAGVRNDNLELHSLLRGAQAQQSHAEERARALEQKAKEADDLKASLDAKVAALAVAEDQLLQEHTARQGAEGRLQQGLRTALGHAAEWAEALQTSYNSSEQELLELRTAAFETCQAVEEGAAQAGSSLASRLHALGGHVTGRVRRALHLGIQKALGVVRSHYEVNFEALAEGYVVPEGVEDEVAMERVDALAADAAGALAEAFEEFLFPDAADAAAPPA
jgi:chromosome segregation ATPase